MHIEGMTDDQIEKFLESRRKLANKETTKYRVTDNIYYINPKYLEYLEDRSCDLLSCDDCWEFQNEKLFIVLANIGYILEFDKSGFTVFKEINVAFTVDDLKDFVEIVNE